MHHLIQPSLHDATPSFSQGFATQPTGQALRIALINNMPDGALLETERHYVDLAKSAGADASLRVQFSMFTLGGIARSEQTSRILGGRYGSIDDLRRGQFDAVVITGAKPAAADLRQEPFWPELTQVLDWAHSNTASTLLSCLAAHAAALHFDGIERVALTRKCSGVFEIEKVGNDRLTVGMPPRWRSVHSRSNDLPEKALQQHGYTILARSDHAGVDLFSRSRGNLLVGFQGHPEYSTDALLREYKRDVMLFLRGQQTHYPELPSSYLDPSSEERLRRFRRMAEQSTELAMTTGFPEDLAIQSPMASWRQASVRVFGNWLACVHALRSDPLRPGAQH